MPLGRDREKVVYGLARARPGVHRYTIWRWVVGTVFTAGVVLLPFTGIMRFDLWGGHHTVLGREVDFVTAAKAFAFPFLAVNVLIVVVSRFFGRYLCGFVCPHGALTRLAEWFRFRKRKRPWQLIGLAVHCAVALLLSAATLAFWVDFRVFTAGSPLAATFAGGFLLGTTAMIVVGTRTLGLRFCRDWCPSGVYFAILGGETFSGIEFAHPENCTDCHACEKSCPVDLSPREIADGPQRNGDGFYPDGLSNFAHCLRCGDCVSACEGTTEQGDGTPLRMGMLSESGRVSAGAERGS